MCPEILVEIWWPVGSTHTLPKGLFPHKPEDGSSFTEILRNLYCFTHPNPESQASSLVQQLHS
jgi:hypothetical protein